MMDRWRDRVAVVTGASEGIGAAIARRLAKDGMKVAALARRSEMLEALEREVINSGVSGLVKGYICDVTSMSDVTAAFRSIEEEFGPISVLVNNAGVFKPVNLADMDMDLVKTIIDTNVNGLLNCIKAGAASMKTHAIIDGHIINISSVAGHRDLPMPEIGTYSATKRAVNAISNSLRAQLMKEKHKIRVSNVSPGLVKSSMTDNYCGNLSVGQYILPEDIADAVAYVLAAPWHVNVSEMIVEPSVGR